MDKRNKTALAYLLIGVAAAGRALLSVPEKRRHSGGLADRAGAGGYLLLPPKAGCRCFSVRRALCWS